MEEITDLLGQKIGVEKISPRTNEDSIFSDSNEAYRVYLNLKLDENEGGDDRINLWLSLSKKQAEKLILAFRDLFETNHE